MSVKQYNLKTLLYMSVVVVIGFIIFNVVSYLLFNETFYERINRENMEHTNDLANQVNAFAINAYNLVQELAIDSDMVSMDPQRQVLAMNGIRSRYSVLAGLTVQNFPGGQTSAKSDGAVERDKLPQGAFSQAGQDNEPFISKAFMSFSRETASERPVSEAYFPLVYEGRTVGNLTADLNLDILQEYIARYDNNGRYSYVIDSEGTVIAHPDIQQVANMYNYKQAVKRVRINADDSGGNRFVAKDIEVPDGLRQMVVKALNGESDFAVYNDAAGKQQICYYTPVDIPGNSGRWAVITIQNKNVAMLPLKKYFVINFLLSLIIMVILIGLILNRTKKLQHMNDELSDANVQLEHIRKEVVDFNTRLQLSNDSLAGEVSIRKQTEEVLRLREQQCYAITSLLVQAPDDQDVLLYTILNEALQMLSAEIGLIALVDERHDSVNIAYVHGSLYRKNQQMPLHSGMFGVVYETGQMLYVENYQEFEQKFNGDGFDCLQSAVMLPLLACQKVAGLFGVTWMDEKHQLDDEKLAALKNFADLASVALEHTWSRLKIQDLAYKDSLTGLPNRASFKNRLADSFASSPADVAGMLMFIDVDDLKSVNDAYGHISGDEIICAAGRNIVQVVDSQAFVARLGGDEFIVLRQGTVSRGEAGKLADRILSVLATDYMVKGHRVHLSASIGIAIYPEDGSTPDDVLKNADNAMYAAKQAGRNCWRFFEEHMQTHVYEKMMLMNQLRQALAKNELQLYYQPQVNLSTNRIDGVEALLRWHNSEYGNISPAQFIPLAEESGLILSIGAWAVAEACEMAGKLASHGYGTCRVSVNVSPRQLADIAFEAFAEQAVARAGIAPNQLRLEITENSLLGCMEESIDKLLRLKNIGFSLSLDDFGTGFSSLTYLRRLPVQELKIDKSFIDPISTVTKKKTIVSSIINMAHALDLEVVAEGVEIEAQCNYLRFCECDKVQGYFFSKPLSEKALLQFLADKR